MNSNFIKAALCTTAILSVAGCKGIEHANETTDRLTRLSAESRAQMRAAQRGEVYTADRPYFGEAVEVKRGSRKGKPLPKAVEGARSIDIASSKKLTIKEYASLISEQTGIPVNIRTVYTLPNGQTVKIPIGTTMKGDHTGALSHLLDKIAARMDVTWAYDGTAITFDRMTTQSYSLSLPTGESQMSTSIGGVTGGSRSVTMSKTIKEHDPWTDLENQLNAVTPAPAHVTYSKSAGRVSVFGPRSVQARAARVIDDFETTFATRIGLEVAVYFVDAEKADDFGVGVSVAGNSGGFLGVAGALSGNGVATLSRGDVTVDFKALAKDASVVDYRLGSTIAQSGVISPIILTRAQNYVSKTTTTTDSNGGTATAVETSTIDTGVSIHALPRLVSRNKIQLSLTLLQNDLANLESFNSGTSTVQLPTVDQRAIQNETVLTPGETLVLSGYEQETGRLSQSGTGVSGFLGLGGTKTGSKRKIRMVVLVRPAIIPTSKARR